MSISIAIATSNTNTKTTSYESVNECDHCDDCKNHCCFLKSPKKVKKINIDTSKLAEILNSNNLIPFCENVEDHDETPRSNISSGEEKNGYYYKNREKKIEYQKKYNRDQGDKIKNYNKDYYLKRRKEILEKAKTKIRCECGCEVQLFNMNSHKKTKKHLKALELVQAMASSS